MNSAFVAESVIRRSGVGFPVKIACLVERAIQIEIKVAAFKGTVLKDFMTMLRVVTDIVVQDELVDILFQLFIRSFGVSYLIFCKWASRGIVELLLW